MDKDTVLDVMRSGFDRAIETVERKGHFYHHNEDRFAHLKATAKATGLTPERSVHALMAKHFTALPDMLDQVEEYDMATFDEYLIDILVYTSYIRGLLIERMGLEPKINEAPLPKVKAKR